MKIEHIEITNLNNVKKIAIPILDNRLVLIAENGAGKTTILRMIFLFLSKQWIKLNEYSFGEMTIVIDGKTYKIDKKDLATSKVSKEIILTEIAKHPLYKKFLSEIFTLYSTEDLLANSYLIGDIETKFDVPSSIILSILSSIKRQKFDEDYFDWNLNILYLPTYRRIERKFNSLYGDLGKRLEQHLKQIIPEITSKILEEKELNEGSSNLEHDLLSLFDELWTVRDSEKWSRKREKAMAIELVEFGMDDVKMRIFDYLTNPSYAALDLNLFLSTCNKYLKDKYITLSKNKTSIQIFVKEEEVPLSIDCLSAGEKQIVSLFSHLLLDKNLFVIFDEPEISISIRWQEMLLNDILGFSVSGLFVATHSPFIINDSDKKYTKGLNELIIE